MQDKYITNTYIDSLTSKYIFASMRGMRYTFKDFKAEYPNDEACLNAVLKNRYNDTCPRCGVVGVKFHPITGRQGFVCSECDRHIYPLANTIFRKSSTSLWNWFYAIYLFSQAKNGVSAKELERHLGVTYKTAWRMAKQIRLLMQEDYDVLGGDGQAVEVDEVYIGGRRKQYEVDRKTPVIGVVEKQGHLKARVVPEATAHVAIPFIKANVAVGTIVHTDESRIYSTLKQHYEHKSIRHVAKQWVVDGVTTNTIEGFWGQLKRSIDGTHHVVSPKYLQQYVNQFAFMYNHRHVPICPVLLERV